MRKFILPLITILVLAMFVASQSGVGGGGQSNVGGGSGGGVAASSPLPGATSGPGPVFNVKNYSAFGDTRNSSNCTISGSTNLNCTDVTFTAADVGDAVSCALNFSTALAKTTFAAFVDSHNMTLTTGAGAGTFICTFGHADDTAVTTALPLALAQMSSITAAGNLSVSTSAPCLYFPAGAYNLSNTSLNIAPASARSGFCILGDGADITRIYWHTGTTNAQGAVVTCTGNVNNLRIEGITFDGGQGADTLSNGAVFTTCNTLTRNVIVSRFGARGWVAQGTLYANKIVSSANSGAGLTMLGGGEMYESLVTNNQGAGLVVQNNTGANQGLGTRIFNNLFDENTGGGGCDVQVQNSTDVWFDGPSIFSSTSAPTCALSVDANSFVHFSGGMLGVFGSESNRGGAVISAGGTLQSSDVHYVATGTANCISNSGAFNDNGGNSCESQFPIASGTSTGTTAVLTLTNVGAAVNTNCSVGDALYVKGASIAGYNGYFPAGTASGITATSATTLTYTTQGSNLGALGAGGIATCRNLQTYTGNLPKALLNNPVPNTCYITGTFAATVTGAPMCNFFLGTATNITHISAASTTVTACSVAPVVTISDGTVSQTLTITTAKSQWDSAVDASTGVGTTKFKPNGTIQVTNTVGTCTTAPTNFSVSYTISPILSN